tara:strand:+ start:1151 stop:1501 length:351 start_codon:yes stop_codon:yes gene_type:complete
MDVWPVSLQAKLNASSFQVKWGTTSERTEMDVGPAKVRSRFTDAVDVYSCSILLDHSEYSTLSVFFKTTLNNGVNQFLFTDPFTEVATAFRFIEPPTITPIGGRTYEVAMSWELLP